LSLPNKKLKRHVAWVFFLRRFEKEQPKNTSEHETIVLFCIVKFGKVWRWFFLNFASAVVAAVAVVAVYLGGVGGLAENERKISADPS